MSQTGRSRNLGYVFRLGYQAFRRELEQALAPHELTVPEYGALSVFERTPQLSSAELARRADVTPQTMNTLVQGLVRRGLLDRRPDPAHGRIVLLGLSDAGRDVLGVATPAVRRVERAALHGLDRADAAVVLRWLSGLAYGPEQPGR